MNVWYMALAQAYTGPMGAVAEQSIWDSLKLLGQGMLGILVVMALIWLVILILNRTTGNRNRKDDSAPEPRPENHGRPKQK